MPLPPMIHVAARMMPSASSPSRSLPEVRYLRVMVSLNVGSQILLRVVKVFDEAEVVAGRTGGLRPYHVAPPPPSQIVSPREDGFEIRHSEIPQLAETSPPEGIWRGNLQRASSLLLHGSLEAKTSSPVINRYIFITITHSISFTLILL